VSKSGELAATNAVTAQTIRFLDSPDAESTPVHEAEHAEEAVSSPTARQKSPKGAERLAIDIPF
jgi:hypothetical protein